MKGERIVLATHCLFANIWDVFGGCEKWIVCGFGVKRINVRVCGSSRVIGGSFMRFGSILYNCVCLGVCFVLFFFPY